MGKRTVTFAVRSETKKTAEIDFPIFVRMLDSGESSITIDRIYRLQSNGRLTTLVRTKYGRGDSRTAFEIEIGTVSDLDMGQWIEPRGEWEHCERTVFDKLMAEFRAFVEELPSS